MADKYLSNTGSNTSPFESASTAATTLSGLLGAGVLSSGERIWCKAVPGDLHTESYSASTTFSSPSWTSAANPARLFCVSDFFTASPPPTTLATGARILTSGAYHLTFYGHWHIYGVRFYPGDKSTSTANLGFDLKYAFIEKCAFILPNSSSSSVRLGLNDPAKIILKDCTYSPLNSSNGILLGKASIEIENLSFDTSESGVVAPANIFKINSTLNPTISVVVKNSDFSALDYGNLLSTSAPSSGTIDFIRCKLRSGAGVVNAHAEAMPRVRLLDCDSGNTNIRYEVYDSGGVCRTSTTIYPSVNPANDGVTSYSHTITTNTLASRSAPFYTDWIERWADGGVPITPYIEVLVGADGGPALNSAELFIEVEYQSDSSSPKGSMVTNAPDAITAGTTLPSGTVSWVGHGFTTPVTHKLSAGSITPNKSGFVRARLGMTKANTTVYYDPQLRW